MDWVGGRVWYLGDSVAGFDPCTRTWRTLPSAGRNGLAFDLIGTSVHAVGKALVAVGLKGDDSQQLVTDLAVIDDRGWHPITLAIRRPARIETGLTIATNAHVILWGGVAEKKVDGGVLGELIGEGVRLDPATATALSISKQGAPSPRSSPHAVWTGKVVFVWGGYTKQPNPYVMGCDPNFKCDLANDGALYDPQRDTWTPIASKNAPSQRAFATTIWTGKHVVVFGGWSDGVLSRNHTQLFDGGIYDPVTNTWEQIPDAAKLFSNRVATSVFADERRILVRMTDEVAIFDLATRAWRKPAAPSTAAEGTRLSVTNEGWPGYSVVGADGSTTLYRLDLATGRWQRAVLPTTKLHHINAFSTWASDRLVRFSTFGEVPGLPDQPCRGDGRACTAQVNQPAGAFIVPRWTTL